MASRIAGGSSPVPRAPARREERRRDLLQLRSVGMGPTRSTAVVGADVEPWPPGIFDRDDATNPFRDDNFVVLPHCAVDGHTARQATATALLASAIEQHGYRERDGGSSTRGRDVLRCESRRRRGILRGLHRRDRELSPDQHARVEGASVNARPVPDRRLRPRSCATRTSRTTARVTSHVAGAVDSTVDQVVYRARHSRSGAPSSRTRADRRTQSICRSSRPPLAHRTAQFRLGDTERPASRA